MKITATSTLKNNFKPFSITVTINIETEDDLKTLKNEFEEADLANGYLGDGDSNYYKLTKVCEEIEKILK